MPGSMPAAASARRKERLLETVIACGKREAFAQGSDTDEAIQALHETEEVYYAVVSRRRLVAYRWSHRLNVRISGACRF